MMNITKKKFNKYIIIFFNVKILVNSTILNLHTV